MGVDVQVKDNGGTRVTVSLENLTQALTFGVHEDAEPYPDGSSVAERGAVHEFGTGKIPQRSFLRGWVDSGGQSVIGNVGEAQIGKVVDGAGVDTVSQEIGEASVKGVVTRMDSGIRPDLAASTLANPKRDQRGIPLEDTERLRESIAWRPAGAT